MFALNKALIGNKALQINKLARRQQSCQQGNNKGVFRYKNLPVIFDHQLQPFVKPKNYEFKVSKSYTPEC